MGTCAHRALQRFSGICRGQTQTARWPLQRSLFGANEFDCPDGLECCNQQETLHVTKTETTSDLVAKIRVWRFVIFVERRGPLDIVRRSLSNPHATVLEQQSASLGKRRLKVISTGNHAESTSQKVQRAIVDAKCNETASFLFDFIPASQLDFWRLWKWGLERRRGLAQTAARFTLDASRGFHTG